ncbi:MAG: ADP-forming succinate--CoA ligase subunit beta [Planctomycetota bacterium]|nr:ADP-forming succinate--CoA ligase subunit beta [Planctomycetota bacterium]
MKLHEYQAKEILARYGLKSPRGGIASSPEEAEAIAKKLKLEAMAIKAQIHAGGRGKAGGIKLARTAEEAKKAAAEIMAKPLVTPQTGPEGRQAHCVLVEEGIEIEREIYIAMTIDRGRGLPVIISSAEGGVEIEHVAEYSPEKIVRALIDPTAGVFPYVARKVARAIGFQKKMVNRFAQVAMSVSRAFLETDASLVEVNPLGITKDGEFIAIDAKFSIDDNALFRQKDLAKLRDVREEDPLEARARESSISYVRMDGEIGCLVNGAGLAMATMDIIKLHKGEPANFLDVGGGADEAQVQEAFGIILEDPRVKSILVNIFGGIMRCDVIARGIISAVKKSALKVPLIVRLEGTKVEEGREILQESGLEITSASDMKDAAEKAVAAAGNGKGLA